MIWELIVLGVILLLGMFLEKFFFEINPILWIVGGITALVFGILEMGVVSWLEAVICFVVTFVLAIIFYTGISRAVGGGVLKGLMMCALFLGRYVFITYFLFYLLLCLMGFVKTKIRQVRKIEEIPGESLGCGMPLVTVSVALTVFIIGIFFV